VPILASYFFRVGVTVLLGYSAISQPSLAVTFADGSTAFVNPPRMVRAITTDSDVYSWSATYYFTIAVPADAGEPLQKVTITQKAGFDRSLDYDLKRSVAFEGMSYRRGKRVTVPLREVTFDRKAQTATVSFDPPVSPGTVVTIGLKPYENPSASGVYLFGVVAYPPGDRPRSQFLGYGRFSFYRSYGLRL
jgi:hypothetical protein